MKSGVRIAMLADQFSAYDARLLKFTRGFRDMGADVAQFAFNSASCPIPKSYTSPSSKVLNALPSLISNPIGYRRTMHVLFKQVTAFAPDVIYCGDILALNLAANLKAAHGIPLIYDAHEYFRQERLGDSKREAWVSKVESRNAASVDLFVTVNSSIGKLYEKLDVAFPKPVIVRNVTDLIGKPYKGELHRAAGLSETQNILLYHGAVSSLRGLERLAAIDPYLADHWSIVMMTTGDPSTYLGSGHQIKILPPVPQSDLATWVGGASLGSVMYSGGALNQVYCSPNKLWEYPFSGVPILGSDLPEISNMLGAYGCGLIIKESDTAQCIAQKISEISQSDMSRMKTGCASLKSGESWKKEWNTFISSFKLLEIAK